MVEFKFKMAWRYGAGPGCTETKIGQYVSGNFIGIKDWKCVSGCSATDKPPVGPVYYTCTAAVKREDWEQGENSFQYTFTQKGPFIISYTGAMWMSLALPYSQTGGEWNLQTIVNLGKRSDTGLPNASPVTASKPLYELQFQCKHELQIPMVDPDGDKVRCRWAVNEECQSICNTVPVATLDEDTCTLAFNADNTNFKDGGWYAAALTIEDFPKAPMLIGNTSYNTSTAITAVPLQFIIHVKSKPLDCNRKPIFVPPTPTQGSHITIPAHASVNTKMYASNARNPKSQVIDMSLTSPPGMTYTGPFKDSKHLGVVYWDLKWTPTAAQKGDNILCGMAEDDQGQLSDTYCFTYIAWDHDPCASTPCHHNGTCNRRGSSQNYDCICPGYTGKLCDSEIDECASNPCQHGGTCTDLFNAFHCSCNPGYNGTSCEIDVDECSTNPCQNKGSCKDGVNSYTCFCPPGYTGINCQSEINKCLSNLCLNGATCTDEVTGYSCLCASGFSGVTCQIDINECVSNPCKFGQCTDQVNGYMCTCLPGYSGVNCDTETDECSSNPCQNGGSCTDQMNAYKCACQKGYSGDNCQINFSNVSPRKESVSRDCFSSKEVWLIVLLFIVCCLTTVCILVAMYVRKIKRMGKNYKLDDAAFSDPVVNVFKN